MLQDEGEVKWLNGLTRGYLDQHADIDRSLTVMEYLRTSFADLYALNEKMEGFYAQMGDADEGELDKLITKANNILDTLTSRGFFEIDATIKKVAGGLGVSAFGYDTPIGTLSGGGRAKLMLTKLLLTKPDIMLLDEPTNFLDIEHIEWLVEFLNGTKSAFLVISHDIDFLDKVCKNIINIENGEIKDEVTVVIKGEIDGNGKIDSDDAIYILRNTLFASLYPVVVEDDVDDNGKYDSDDAIHLLRYTLFPSMYPLK